MSDPVWTEDTSAAFRDLAHYAVPERELQVETILSLIPQPDGAALAMDICCGAGGLTAAMLERIPTLRVLALDGSQSMLETTRTAAGRDAERLDAALIDIADTAWRTPPEPLHAVVSSLAIHHLDGPGKQRLFADIHAALKPGGVFVMADLVEPVTAAGRRIAGDAWDAETRRRALDTDGTLGGYERFVAEDWNYYRLPGPDPLDKPSSVTDLLDWLRGTGFQGVDLHWMKAGHVIMSGVRG
ncbi:class I SAM-dependent methyltransferase [Thalassobaculum litoreum]|uniref:tRNA (Cmo5U34)-methyltransferase n=1 Tax=Thalassobaculum litoreum DSM 18839 TaxID=1123362 RepID=A0A8G2BF95_9PROT|nr:class I SAM-dependent methyltransferase [Thalassobaculum litoreum]SDF30869.1 tRNA (cmo5U34)-methyltransferase [Thalassobaculum litoreum DSM 18839]